MLTNQFRRGNTVAAANFSLLAWAPEAALPLTVNLGVFTLCSTLRAALQTFKSPAGPGASRPNDHGGRGFGLAH